MGNLFENLKNYFENTPKDVLENDWKEIEYLNEIGPNVIEYAEYIKEKFGIELSYSNIEKNMGTHKFEVSVFCNNNSIPANSSYCFAA